MTTTAGASKFFPKAQEGFTTTTSGLVASGAATVGLNSTGNYSNGDTGVWIIDPGVSGKEQSFTGVVDTGGVQVTSAVWLSGTNVPHVSGATIVDYVAAGHIDLISTGVLVSHNSDGTPKASITYPASTFTTPTITDFSSATHNHTNNAGGGPISLTSLTNGGATATVLTSETTTSTSYADLATTTDTVTVTVGANGLLLVGIYCGMTNSGSNFSGMSFALSGANTQAASDTYAVAAIVASLDRRGTSFLLSGLVAGSTTVKAKYSVNAGTGTFVNRRIYAIPL